MKKQWILTICLLVVLVPMTGCETMGLIGAGAGAGITLDRILQQAAVDVNENIDYLEAQNIELEQQLAEAETDAEKEIIRAQIQANLKWLDQLKILQLSLQGGRQGIRVKWDDPQSVMLFISGGIIPGILAYLQWRKKQEAANEKNKLNTALEEVVEGGQEFKRNAEPEILDEFKVAHKNKQSAETKQLVAMIKA